MTWTFQFGGKTGGLPPKNNKKNFQEGFNPQSDCIRITDSLDICPRHDSCYGEMVLRAEGIFQVLQKALGAQPVPYSPDFSKDFVVQTDAPNVGLGTVLSQIQDVEKHPSRFS